MSSRSALEPAVWDDARREYRLLRSISPQFHGTRLELYWTHYNAGVPLVDRASFEQSVTDTGGLYHCQFLHLSMLAMGYHFADQSNQDVRQIMTISNESTFHYEAKSQVWQRLRSPKLSTAAALIILSDLEFQVGNSALGRRFTGTSVHS